MNPTNWFGVIVLYTAITLLCVYLIPSNSAFSVLTAVLGFTFVAFIPGYCLVSFLFSEGKLDLAEKAVLSVALSFSVSAVSGLFLGLTRIGINTASITVTLSAVVVVLAFLAFLRKKGLIKVPSRGLRVEPPAQVRG